MRTTVQYTYMHAIKHICQLPKEEPLLIMYISTGWCVSFRRYIRKKTLVNPKNKAAINLYNSVSAFKKEMEVHMKRDFYMVHPYSEFKAAWETWMIFAVLISLFYYPSLVYVEDSPTTICINTFFFITFTIDIIVNFITGYFSADENRVILNRREVAKHYLKRWFFFDVICLINLNGMLARTINSVLNFLNIIRISMIVRYISGFTECTQIAFYQFHFTKLMMITLIIVWWATSFLYYLVSIFEEPWMNDISKHGRAITCYYRISYLIFLVGYGEGYSESSPVLLFEIVCWIGGTILKIFCFAEVLQIVIKYSSSRNMYHQRIQRLKQMMQIKRLPNKTRLRILQYFDFRYQKNYFQEDEILACFSSQLKDEILGHSCRQLIENSSIFDHLPCHIIERIVLKMRPIIYLRNDVIVHAEDEGGSMFFVHDGAVALYSKEGVERCHVGDGGCFGERAMILKDTLRISTVIAIDACELYVLYTNDFEECVSIIPRLVTDTRKKVDEKYQKYSFSRSNNIYML